MMPPADSYRALFEAAPDGILLVDASGTILEANPQACHLLGYGEAELVGCPIEVLVPESARGEHRGHREGYLRDPRPRPMGIGMELSAVRKDGVLIPVEISLSPLDAKGDPRVIAIVRDLSERRRLRGFGAASVRAAEDERRRIARELHDDTAQSLAALMMRLKVLERRLEGHPAASDLMQLREGLHQTAEGVRGIARGLRPPELEDVGLEAALRSHVRARFPDKDIRLAFDGAETRLGLDQTLAAYRIAQEALANAVRHGSPQSVTLRIGLAEGEREVLLEVVDDGRGFEPHRLAEPEAGLGLVGMDERAQLAGGRFELESRPGEGTRVRAFFPVLSEAGHG